MPKNIEIELIDRFVRYAKIHTTSKAEVDNFPSTTRQFDLANILAEELKAMGVSDAKVTENCVVIGTLEPNIDDPSIPCICFNSHLDTASEESGENVNPQIVNYQGGDVVLNEKAGVKISVEDTPELADYIGSKIITTDGNTLLGADDKAGIAEIMTAVSILVSDPSKKHGKIRILFTPDEEVERGAESIPIEEIGADFAFTIDGEGMGNLEIENFNAASGKITIQGTYVHEGFAYGKMVNSMRFIPEVLDLFPKDHAPETSQGYEHYFHPYEIRGDVATTQITFLLRNFDDVGLETQIQEIEAGIAQLQKKGPNTKFSVEIKHSYKNMKKVLDKHPKIVEIAKKAIERAEIELHVKPVRGGTDGARFTYMGMPTPNIFTGGYNFHTKKEFVAVNAMLKAVETIVNIAGLTVEEYQTKN